MARINGRLPTATPILVIGLVLVAVVGMRLFKTVPPGHVAVATLFGKIVRQPYPEGLHIPVNPLYEWRLYDARQKTHTEVANVPSRDQLQTRLEVSVQYRLIGDRTPEILGSTGTAPQLVDVHLAPKLRSLLREQGKSIRRAEDLFLEETQEKLQDAMLLAMDEFMRPRGVNVTAVLIRDIQLPSFITKAIEGNSSYFQLQALDALKSIAGDRASKIFFLGGDSPILLLLHLGATK